VAVEERMMRAIIGIEGKPILETLVYFGSLNLQTLIESIGEMEKFCEFD
jgi:hypothetical protein